MKAVQIANTFIARHGREILLTNLAINKLVYYAQAESLRRTGCPLYDDPVEAWQYGPVERGVYFAFNRYGRNRITEPSGPTATDPYSIGIVDDVADKYGKFSAFDLVRFSHREGSAWKAVYSPNEDREITNEAILASADGKELPPETDTFSAAIDDVSKRWSNTFNILRNA